MHFWCTCFVHTVSLPEFELNFASNNLFMITKIAYLHVWWSLVDVNPIWIKSDSIFLRLFVKKSVFPATFWIRFRSERIDSWDYKHALKQTAQAHFVQTEYRPRWFNHEPRTRCHNVSVSVNNKDNVHESLVTVYWLRLIPCRNRHE